MHSQQVHRFVSIVFIRKPDQLLFSDSCRHMFALIHIRFVHNMVGCLMDGANGPMDTLTDDALLHEPPK